MTPPKFAVVIGNALARVEQGDGASLTGRFNDKSSPAELHGCALP
ncbi:MAG: hypothetical protein ABJK59_01385 [Erythrobacter sp.]